MVNVGIVGASGYTGAELVRLLSGHPNVQLAWATSESFAGRRLGELYPALGPAGGLALIPLNQADLSPRTVQAVFLAVPHGESMKLAPKLVEAGLKVIDLSGDFRFPDTTVYEDWYRRPHTAPEWAGKAVYGLPELFREQVRNAALVANPGCYVTSAVLALYPLVKAGVVDCASLIVDAKSGITGAGRKIQASGQFSALSENLVPYKLAGAHQHTPEMELALEHATGRMVRINFTPQLAPARRGILSLVYGRLTGQATTDDLARLYQEAYGQEPFVQVRGAGQAPPELATAVYTNLCVVGAWVDERTRTVTAAGSLDNLIKGASGQAIQNMNLMFGVDETLGLPRIGIVP